MIFGVVGELGYLVSSQVPQPLATYDIFGKLATWCHSLTKFSALQLRKAGGKAGHQATQFTGALVVLVVVMVKVVKTLMMLGGL